MGFNFRKPKITVSLAALIIANLVPLAGVFFFKWDAAVIVLLYWTENVVAGFYNILRMAFLKMDHPIELVGKVFAILFFMIHFGGFCAVHGMFVMVFCKINPDSIFPSGAGNWPGPLIFVQLLFSVITTLWKEHPAGMEWSVLCLFVSHGISFVQNFIIGKEYTRLSMEQMMQRPYTRIVMLHIALIAGAAPTMLLGSPVPLVCLLVLGKIIIDIRLHEKSHDPVVLEKIIAKKNRNKLSAGS